MSTSRLHPSRRARLVRSLCLMVLAGLFVSMSAKVAEAAETEQPVL